MPLPFSPRSFLTSSAGVVAFAQFQKLELRWVLTNTCVFTLSLFFVVSGYLEFMETRISCKTESSLLIKKSKYSFNWQEERLHNAAPAPEMGTALLWACVHALPWHGRLVLPWVQTVICLPQSPGRCPIPRCSGRRVGEGSQGHDVTSHAREAVLEGREPPSWAGNPMCCVTHSGWKVGLEPKSCPNPAGLQECIPTLLVSCGCNLFSPLLAAAQRL